MNRGGDFEALKAFDIFANLFAINKRIEGQL